MRARLLRIWKRRAVPSIIAMPRGDRKLKEPSFATTACRAPAILRGSCMLISFYRAAARCVDLISKVGLELKRMLG